LGGLTARLGNVGVNLDNVGVNGPGNFTVKNAAGATVDETNLNNYVIVNGTSNESDGTDTQRSINGSLRRDFFGKIPASLKIGGLISQQVRDVSRPANSKSNYNFVGADGIATNTTTMATAATDDNARLLMDKYNSYNNRLNKSSMPLYQVPDPVASAELFQAQPTYWVASSPINDYNSRVNSSKYARETIYAGYLRNDLAFFRNRLKVVSGIRLEQTDIYGEGPSNDPTRNFQRDANGVILRTGNPLTGTPVPVFPAGTLDAQKLILRERGLKSNKEYLRPLPSVNVSYMIRENLIARGSYYWSLGRPDFSQYSNGVTLPNLANPPSATGNFIQVSNAGIKAWSARTTKVGLEYYFEGVGAISINGWQREFQNLFGNIDFAATPAFLDLYGLSFDTYGQYYVRTTYNATDVTMRGLDFAYKQSLTFLPGWGKNFGVFTNASWTRFSGPGRDQLTNNLAVPRTAAWGINYRVPRFGVMLNWNYRGMCRQSLITGTGIEAGTYNYQAPRLYCDLTLDYRMKEHFSFFANLRNLRNQGIKNLAYGPNTPEIARLRNYEDYGMELTGGVKAKF
jgi:TonB-dependent receptor